MIHIHSFRVGKTYVEFEKEFFPRIFLIEGQNGSGKSFFLRCLFSLLRNSRLPDLYENYLADKVIQLVVENASGDTIHLEMMMGILRINGKVSTLCSRRTAHLYTLLGTLQDVIFFMSEENIMDWLYKGVDLRSSIPIKERNFFRYGTLLPIPRYGTDSLSTGQLKRESIMDVLTLHKYWSQCSGGVVLMDDLDANLHPDWQYQIIRDLREWAPQHQYIIATHSYDMCEALTPAHVKEVKWIKD